MNPDTFAEQLGVMQIIDEMHARALKIDELLNLPKLKADLTERLLAYYARQEQPVSKDVIEAGVQRYFDGRLRLRPAKFSRVTFLLIRVWITREQWARPAGKWVGATALVMFLLLGAAGGVGALRTRVALAELEAVTQKVVRGRFALAQHFKAAYDRQAAAEPKYASTVAARRRVDDAFQQMELALRDVPSERPADLAEIQRAIAVGSAAVDRATQVADVLNRGLSAWERLNEADATLVRLEQAGDYQAMYRDFLTVEEAVDAARDALREGLDTAHVAVNAAANAVTAARALAPVKTRLTEMDAAFAKLGLTTGDMAQISAIKSQFAAALRRADAASVKEHLASLEVLLRVASSDLSLQIVSRAGERSGVERKYGPTGGKATYLVVEAIDPLGAVVPLRIESSETGKTKTARTFAVRVPREEYERVRKEKSEAGHVRDRLVGNKPIGRLAFAYVRPVLAERITEW